ncbi:MAG: DUF1127 domain-containing protein [Devosia sp.]|jgi:uncharacterized protein YjiS (DUF1127 family)
MTTIDHETMPLTGIEAQKLRFRTLQKIADLLGALSRRRQRKRAYEELSRLDAHLLRDMGINPDDVRDAFEGRRSSLLFEPIRRPFNRG